MPSTMLCEVCSDRNLLLLYWFKPWLIPSSAETNTNPDTTGNARNHR